jgi:hypothetical protein
MHTPCGLARPTTSALLALVCLAASAQAASGAHAILPLAVGDIPQPGTGYEVELLESNGTYAAYVTTTHPTAVPLRVQNTTTNLTIWILTTDTGAHALQGALTIQNVRDDLGLVANSTAQMHIVLNAVVVELQTIRQALQDLQAGSSQDRTQLAQRLAELNHSTTAIQTRLSTMTIPDYASALNRIETKADELTIHHAKAPAPKAQLMDGTTVATFLATAALCAVCAAAVYFRKTKRLPTFAQQSTGLETVTPRNESRDPIHVALSRHLADADQAHEQVLPKPVILAPNQPKKRTTRRRKRLPPPEPTPGVS